MYIYLYFKIFIYLLIPESISGEKHSSILLLPSGGRPKFTEVTFQRERRNKLEGFVSPELLDWVS